MSSDRTTYIPQRWRGDSPTDASRFSGVRQTLVVPVEWQTYRDVTIDPAPVQYLGTFHRTVSICLRCGTQVELMLILVGEHEDEWICGGCLDLALGELEND